MIDKLKAHKPQFLGREKFVYELMDILKQRFVDRLVLMDRKDDEVINRAIELFNANDRRLLLKLNGEVIHRFKPAVKSILDIETGNIFTSVRDMADFFGYSIYEANKRLKTNFRFKWID
jgi:hypothetical protein